jgi:uncharacterized coiled-coil protein SlyX
MKRIRKDDDVRPEYDFSKLKLKPAPANRRPKVTLIDLINALPKPLRDFIHDLQTRTDPAGDVQTIASLKDQVAQMQKQIQVLKAKIRRLEKKTSGKRSNKS